MKEYQSLSHTRWDCKYHVVFIPKRRKKLLLGKLRKHLGEVLHDLGHSDPKVTMRYAHLSTKALQEAANSAAVKIR